MTRLGKSLSDRLNFEDIFRDSSLKLNTASILFKVLAELKMDGTLAKLEQKYLYR